MQYSETTIYLIVILLGLGCDFVNKPCNQAATYPYLCYPNVTRAGCNFDFQARVITEIIDSKIKST